MDNKDVNENKVNNVNQAAASSNISNAQVTQNVASNANQAQSTQPAQVQQTQPAQVQPTQPTQQVQVQPAQSNQSAPVLPAQAPQQEQSQGGVIAPKPNDNKVHDQVILNIKEEKGGNIFGVIFFFVIILSAVYFLPTIYNNIGLYIPFLGSKEKPIDNTNKELPVLPDKEDENKYPLDGNLSEAKIDGLSFGNFVKSNSNGYTLSFYIINNEDNTFTFDDNTKFYLELYEDSDYISSALVYSYEPIGFKDTKNFELEISKNAYNKANKFKILRRSKSEYPNVELKSSDGEYKVLSCTRKNRELKYYFIDNYLEKIDDIYTEQANSSTYSSNLEKYNSYKEEYDSIEAMDYNIIETTDNFVAKLEIDLSKINDKDINRLAKYEYFAHHKELAVVAFDMKAKGYTCS